MNKVSKELIEKKIVDKIFKKLSGKLTHCTLILENGFEVTGESACVDPANYDIVIGERMAYENAFEKIWSVEGYLLQEKLYLESKLQAEIDNGIYGYFKDGEEIDLPIGTRLKELSPATVVPFTEDLLTIARTQKIKKTSSKKYSGILQKAPLYSPAMANKMFYGEQLTNNEFNKNFNDLTNPSLNQHYKSYLTQKKITFSDGTVIEFDKMSSNIAHQIFDELLKETGFGSATIRELMFSKLFPEATENDFKKLENRQAVTDELSFMEKYEGLCLEKSKLVATGITNKAFNYFQTGLKNIILEELSNISKVLSCSGVKTDEQKQVLAKLIEAKMWIVEYQYYILKTETNNTTVKLTDNGLKM
jgi:hypothetical protein